MNANDWAEHSRITEELYEEAKKTRTSFITAQQIRKPEQPLTKEESANIAKLGLIQHRVVSIEPVSKKS